MIRVSVIIPAENNNENLKRCLSELKKQSFTGFEVIVVLTKDSCHCEAKPKQSRSGLPRSFHSLAMTANNPSLKRNWGAKKAKGEFLAFIDDDCFVEKDWLKNGVKLFSKDVCAVCGPMKTPENSPFWERVAGYLWESPLINPINIITVIKVIEDWPSANFMMRKSDFEKLGRTSRCTPSGGFDSRFWPGEDTKLCLDIVTKLKKKIIYDPNVVVYHKRRPIFGPFLTQVARYARQRGKFARLFPKTSRKWQYFVPSLFLIYLTVALFYDRLLYLMPVYITLLIIEGIRAMAKDKNVLTGIVFIIGVFLTHIMYGVNFIRGLLL